MEKLWTIFFRSFFLQSLWNFERMQNIGFVYMIAGFIKKMKISFEEKRDIFKRHLEFFNIHPYFAPLIAGMVVSLEEQKADPKRISTFKMTFSGPLAAMGDTLFWGTWSPFVGLLGVCLFVIFSSGSLWRGTFWIVLLITIFLYNILHFHVKIKGLKFGYKDKTEIFGKIQRMPTKRVIFYCRIGGVVFSLLLLLIKFWSFTYYIDKMLFLLIFFLTLYLNKKGINIIRLFYIILGVVYLLVILFGY